MKNLLLLLLLMWQVLLYAQQGTVNTTGNIPDELDNLLSPIDKSKVTTGFLLDLTTPFADLEDFDGKKTSTVNLVNADRFGMIYATLYGACVSQKQQLPSPNTYMPTSTSKGNVSFPFLFMKYNDIDENAVTNNLLSFNKGQIFDVSPRKQEPYTESIVFAATPMESTFDIGRTYNFNFSSNLFFSNITNSNTNVIEIDFGSGFQTITLGGSSSISFKQVGLQEISIRMTDKQGVIWRTHAQVEIRDESFKLSSLGRGYSDFPDDEFDISTKSGAKVQIFYACPSKKQLRKPMIILDGFDPPELKNRTYAAIFDRLKKVDNPFNLSQNIIEKIFEEEYDIVFVDWKNGADWLEDNAQVAIDVIKEVNKRKKTNGSTEQNFIIGASMGGVIGKLALANMEEQGLDHDTETYFNLDGPMRGANVPLGIQYMADHITNRPVTISKGLFGVSLRLKNFVPGFDLFEKIMNRPAVRQFLFYHVYAPKNINPYKSGFLQSPEHKTFYDMFSKKKLTKCKYVCLSNGSGVGQPQIYSAGDCLLHTDINKINAHLIIESVMSTTVLPDATFSFGDRLLVHGLLAVASKKLEVALNLWAQPKDDKLGVVYSGDITLQFRKINPLAAPLIISTKHSSFIDNCKHYDSAPGGTLGDIFKFLKVVELGYNARAFL